MSQLIEKKYNGLSIYCRNEIDYNILFDEIFEKEVYKFFSDKQNPFIIDCGSNIGLSVLYFKMLYPKSYIIAFEPDKDNYEILLKNIKVNQLKDVIVHNIALSNKTGEIDLYYEPKDASSLGNTINPEWGDRDGFLKKKVKTDRLSNYLQSCEVDFLKLDIEGSEKLVIDDIRNQLSNIRELVLEYHNLNRDNNKADYKYIENLLERSGFLLNIENINFSDLVPSKHRAWLNQYRPSITLIRGKK